MSDGSTKSVPRTEDEEITFANLTPIIRLPAQHANLEFPAHLPANPPAPSNTPRESLPGIGVGMNGVRWAYAGTGGHYSFIQRMQNAAAELERRRNQEE